MDQKDVIVKKPWGQEYLCYHNKEIAIWFLHIKKGEKTSLHCHPNKNTGFVVLDGQTKLSFIRGGVDIYGLNKINIFRSRFHSTYAVTDAFIFEIETPEDKEDLIRLEDSYGREDKPYESSSHHLPKNDACIWIDEASLSPKNLDVCGCNIQHIEIMDKKELLNKKEEEIFVITNGGLVTDESGKRQKILWPGDTIDGETLNRLAQAFKLDYNTTVLHITKNV